MDLVGTNSPPYTSKHKQILKNKRLYLLILFTTVLACGLITFPVVLTDNVSADTSGDLIITDETEPSLGQELEPGKEYTFDIDVAYQLPENKEGTIKLYLADVSNKAYTKSVEGTGEGQTVTFTITATVPKEQAGDTFYVSSILYDSNGEFVEGDDETWDVKSGDNTPPSIDNYTPSSEAFDITEGDSVDFQVTASDPNNEQLTHKWYINNLETDNGYQLLDSSTGDTSAYSRTFTNTNDYAIKVEVSDEQQAQDKQVWTIGVQRQNENQPPQVERLSPSATSLSLEQGASERFEVEVSDQDADLERLEWRVDGQEEFTSNLGVDASYQRDWERKFENAGEHTVEAVIIDSNGNTDSLSWSVNVEAQNQDRQPQIDSRSPSQSTISISESKSETFEVEVSDPDNDLERVEWFIDGARESRDLIGSNSPQSSTWTHQFNSPGDYTVKAVVTDSNGNRESISWKVSVSPTEVDGDLIITGGTTPSFSRELKPEEKYTFEVEVDYQLTVNAQGTIELYLADVSDKAYTKSVEGTGESETVTFTITATVPKEQAGDTFYVSSVLHDSNGEFVEGDDETWNVESGENTPPTIDNYGPSQEAFDITEGDSVDFEVTASDPDNEQLTHEWYIRDIDEGGSYRSLDSSTGDRSSYLHTFTETGDYAVKVEVSDEQQAQDEQVWVVGVQRENENKPPQIDRVSPSSATLSVDEGTSETFEVEVSDPDADLETVEWFVDGEKEFTSNLGADASYQRDWTRTFEDSTQYTVKAVVTDSNGNTDSVSWTVNEPSDLEVLDLEMRPSNPEERDDVEFRVKVRNSGDGAADSVEVRVFVDGELVHVPPTLDLSPGDEQYTVWSGNTNFEPGTHTAVAVVDPDNKISEETRENNRIERRFSVEEQTESYRLVANTEGDGAVEIDPPGITSSSINREYEEETEVTLTATAGSDSRFVGWEGDTGNSDADAQTIQVTMDQAREITATFQETTISASLVGFDTRSGTYRPGESVSNTVTVENTGTVEHTFWVDVSARPPSGGWSVGEGTNIKLAPGERQTVELSWSVPTDAEAGLYDTGTAIYNSDSKDVRNDGQTTLEAFEVSQPTTTHSLSVQSEAGGGVEIDPPGVTTSSYTETYEEGTTVELTAVPGQDLQFTGWTGDVGGADGKSIQVKMDQDREIYANFKESSQTGAVQGTVTDQDGEPIEGAQVSLSPRTQTVTNADGEYSFTDVEIGEYEMEVLAGSCYNIPTQVVSVSSGETVTQNFELTAQTYTIQLDSEPINVDTSGEGTYKCGAEVEVSAPSASGDYEFLGWETRNGESVRDQSTFTFSYLTNDWDIVAQYQKQGQPDLTITGLDWSPAVPTAGDQVEFTLEVTNQGEARATSSSFELLVENDVLRGSIPDLSPGETTTLRVSSWDAVAGSYDVTAEVDSENELDEEDESNNGVSQTVTVAERTQEFTLDVQTSGGGEGRVSLTPPGVDRAQYTGTYEDGKTVELSAVPSQDATFVGWEGDIGNSNSGAQTIQVTMDQAREVTAIFEEDLPEYTLSVNTEAGGGVEIDPPGVSATSYTETYTEDSVIELTAVADQDTTFAGWTGELGNVDSDSQTIQVTVDQAREITATFEEKTESYRLVADTEGDGVVEIDPPGISSRSVNREYEGGTEVTLTATAGADSRFVGWEGETGSTDRDQRTITVTVDRAREVTAKFEEVSPEATIVSIDNVPDQFRPGDKIAPIVRIRNTGDTEETFNLEMTDRTGIQVSGSSTRTTTLSPGTAEAIEFNAEFYGTEATRVVEFDLMTDDGQVIDSSRRRIAYADTALSVQVLNSDGNPISGATVSLLSKTETIQTDEEGRAQIRSLSTGQRVIKVSHPQITGSGQTKTIEVSSGEQNEATVRLQETATISGTVVNQKGDPLSDGIVTINGQHEFIDSDGTFHFDGRFAAGNSYTVHVAQNGESLYRENIRLSPGENELTLTVKDANDGGGGWGIINNANKGAVLGEVGVQMGIPASKTLEYHIGWLGGSMVPVADIPADIRDCILAPNDDLSTNALDCGGAAASTLGSAGTVLGAITSPSGGGAVLAAGSISFDTAEDISDVIKVSNSVVRNVPNKVDEWAEVIVSKAGDQTSRVVSKIDNSRTATTLRKSIDKVRLRKAGFSSQQANKLVDSGASRKAATRLADNGADSQTIVRLAENSNTNLENLNYAFKYHGLIYKISKSRWDHIVNRHVTGSADEIEDTNHYFPTGERISAKKNRPAHTTPDRMSRSDVKQLIEEAIDKKGTAFPADEDDLAKIVYRPEKYGIDKMRVVVGDNGQVITAYPTEGSAVDTFRKQSGKWG